MTGPTSNGACSAFDRTAIFRERLFEPGATGDNRRYSIDADLDGTHSRSKLSYGTS